MSSQFASWRRDPANQPAYDMTADQTQYAAIVKLNEVLHLLSPRDRDFAISLQAQQASRRLSDTRRDPSRMCQMEWVHELIRRGQAVARGAAPLPPVPAGAVKAVTFENLVALFAKAGARAFVVLRTEDGTDFRLSVAGERSSHPGSINVTDTSRSFEDRVWFGRINQQGGWLPSRKTDAATQGRVEAALLAFNADPAKAAAEYGHATGSCCFCARLLTDERSVTVGYGPVCADRFGLPWGATTEPKLSCQEVAAERAQTISDAEIPF